MATRTFNVTVKKTIQAKECPECHGTDCRVSMPVLASDYSFVNADWECENCGREGTANYVFGEIDLYDKED